VSDHADVLVLGSGIGGLMLALKAARHGDVLVLTKKKADDSSTNWAQGGIAAVFERDDEFRMHVADTLACGAGLSDLDVVRTVVREAPDRVRELAELGVAFNRKGSSFELGREGGHSHRRIVHASDFTGRAVEQTLLERVRRHPRIRLIEDQLAVDLILESKMGGAKRKGRDTCWGAYVMDRASGHIRAVTARVTVLATGGSGKVYLYTSNPDVATGDGIAMAYRAGAAVEGLEFVQFHPTALAVDLDPLPLLSEALRGEGATLVNDAGLRFMPSEHADAELAPRDVVARGIWKQLAAGRKVFLDGRAAIGERVPRDRRHPGRDLVARGDVAGARLFERADHLGGGREPRARIDRQRPGDDRVDGRRDRRVDARRLGDAGHHLGDDGHLVVSVEEPTAGEELPEDDGRGVDVGPGGRVPGELLRRHVRELALHLTVAGLVQPAPRLGDAEVEDARDAVGPDEHVLWRDVAVDDTEGALLFVGGGVGRAEAREQVERDRDRDPRRDPLPRRPRAAHEAPERLALHVGHDGVDAIVRVHQVEDRDDVGVGHPRREASLVEEHAHDLGPAREVRMELLDRDRVREARARDPPPVAHLGHASAAEAEAELVAGGRERVGHARGRCWFRASSDRAIAAVFYRAVCPGRRRGGSLTTHRSSALGRCS
jgi:hypothetical protein